MAIHRSSNGCYSYMKKSTINSARPITLEVETRKKQIFKQLESRVWLKTESLTHYVLSMQQIAQNAPIDESELVEFIVDGLRDNTGAAMIFGGITTLEALKALLPKYEKMSRNLPNRNNASSETARCYNCSRYGHMAWDGKQEKRAKGSCFKCGKVDHIYKNCPAKTIAAMEGDEEDYKSVHYRETPE
ncbi:PREDICTED: uncharacterized protein LOC108357943 [Rhagoletis zephyria]|uniref:uncharacterized protein LOC108357943 n=1 Tax=Rhagoletis zephyria TaxID=28612 RepID=UPI0008112B75|nr:PREDICTED: uncharacterized protein LOC108357943 [Rhagoletis zephyria]